MRFYSLYSKSEARYCAPFLAFDDGEAISTVTHMVLSSHDPGLIMQLDDLRLDQIGAFLPESDDPLRECRPHMILDSLQTSLPLPPLVKEKVDELYKVKEVENE